MSKNKRFKKGKKLSIEEGLSLIEVGGDEMLRKDVDGDLTYVNLIGMQMFKAKGCNCNSCDTTGMFFRKEKTDGPPDKVFCNWHLNLYAVDYLGREILMTKDHTVPRSEGGPDTLENLEPMCKKCNNKKGTMSKEEWDNRCEEVGSRLNYTNEDLIVSQALELWEKEMNPGDFASIVKQIAFNDSEKLALYDKVCWHVVKIVSTKRHICVSYDMRKKAVTEVISKERCDAIDRSIPYWAQNYVREYKETRRMLQEKLKKDFKKFPDAKEAITYYKSYKYPELMFRKWKKIPLGESLKKACKKEMGL